ncbi:MAG: ATP-dependent RecD-like DNA helicase [Planctomycetes bacterium]|nr:ATP-dependent RecD-like DNA helicase [Planctomycetota bacterium]
MSEWLPFRRAEVPADDDARVELDGTLLVITYRNDTNGWTVARLEVEGHKDPVTLVGSLPGVEVGDSLRVRGRWTDHPSYGKQLAAESAEMRPPSGRKGLVQYLGGGRIKGVGPKTAEAIVDALGLDVLDVLERDPHALAGVKGIGPAKAMAIVTQLAEQRESAAALVFLQEHGLGAAASMRVFKHYGSSTVETVRSNPYRMADEVFGIGFRTADALAMALGHEPDSGYRIASGLLYLLGRAALEGHVGLPVELLLERGAEFLEVSEQRAEQVLVECLHDGRLVDDGLVYRPELLHAELVACNGLRALVANGQGATSLSADAAVQRAELRTGLTLSDDQRRAVALALTHPVSVITGGPGVGKTTLVRCLVDVLHEEGCEVSLAAPTGRAARRLEQATGREAATLHRLLQLRPTGAGFLVDRSEPLKTDVLIVDETSMVDIALMAQIVSALPLGASLVMVGDVDQLPSVGPGEVLRSLITSETIPVARLTTIYRQAEHSGIVRVAHEINAGRVPCFDEGQGGQAFWVERPDAEGAVDALCALLAERIPQVFGLHPLRDVQVLTPMHKGPVGTVALNVVLRAALNPPAPGKVEIERYGRTYRAGDKVMQVRNNYELDVFNGDVGILKRLSEADGGMVDFDGREVAYGLDQLSELEPAFAITCHKSQGSEFPAVLLPLFRSQYMMLRRNLVYTAFTRAKRLLVGLGEWSALQTAIATVDTGRRYGRLAERLRGE